MTGSLKSALSSDGLVVAPGVFDMISLRFAASAGCKVAYMTGYGTVASHLGVPDAGIASYRDMVSRVQVMGAFCRDEGIALVADGDTGYGNPLNVAHTVRGYEAAGAQAIQLEDQTFPKKCGHVLGREVIPTEEMVAKIKAAVEARRSDDFLIIARTDSRTVHGLDHALARMERYAEAGADILFVESPETEEELATIGGRFDKPTLINLVEGGRTPMPSHDDISRLGFKLAIYPATAFLAVGAVLERVYRNLANGAASDDAPPLHNFEEFGRIMGFEEVYDMERRYRA